MKKRNLEKDFGETKVTRFRMRKSKKFWITSSALIGFTAIALGLMLMMPSKNIVYAAPPSSGNVNWIPEDSILTMSNGEKVTYLRMDDAEQTTVYCLAQGAPLTNSSTSAQQDAMNQIWTKLKENQRSVINNIAYLANQSNANTNRTVYAAARLAIWHQMYVYGISQEDATPSMISEYGPDSTGVTTSGIQTEFDKLISDAQALTNKPSFDGQTVKVVVGVPKTLTDSNNVLSRFSHQINSVSGLEAKIDGNTLTLNSNSGTKLGSSILGYSTGFNANIGTFVYSTGGDNSGTNSQPVVTSVDPYREDFSLKVNTVLDGSLKIVKKQSAQDSHQGSGNVQGAKFDVTMYQSDGKTIDTGINGTFDTVDSSGAKTGSVTFTNGVAHDVTTGKDGTVTIKDFSPVGDIAKSQETYVPAPYTLGHSDSKGTLVNDPIEGKITEDSTTGTEQLTFTDNKQVGGVKFKKSGLFNGSDLLNSAYQFKGTVMGVKDKDGNVVSQAILDEKGEGNTTDNPLSSPLVIGQTYTAFEISAGAGFANTFAPKEITFTYKGSDQVIDWENVAGTNTEVTGDVSIEKTVKDASSNQKEQDTQGANVTIFYREDVKDVDGNVIHHAGDMVNLKDGLKGKPITVTSGKQDEQAFPNESGDLTVRISDKNDWHISGLPSAKYYAQETQAGYGESLNTTKYNFDITKTDDKTTVIKIKQGLTNQALRWNMMFTKVLESNSSLTGLNDAKFQMIPMDNNTKKAFESYAFLNHGDTVTSGTATSGNGFTTDGLTAFYSIPLGTIPDEDSMIARYQIKEIETPKGTKTIVPINIDVKANLNSDGAIQSYTYKIYWSDSKQMIHEETYSAENLKDDNVLTIRPDLGLIADEVITQPAITTTAVDASDNDEKLGVGNAKIHDNAKVANINPSTEYTLTGKAVNQSDGTPVIGKDGKQVTSSVKFESDSRGNASVDLETPEFETTNYQGKKITMLETVTDQNGKEVVKEDNWKNNPSQTVSVDKVEGSTQVKDSVIKIGSTVTTTDTYHYKGLVVGQKYTVSVSTASINHTDKTIPVKGQVTFVAKTSDGQIDIPITLNTMDVSGSDLTFTNESLYIGTDTTTEPIHNNNNPKDSKETVHVNKPQPHKDETNSPTAGIKDDSMRNDDKDISSSFKLIGDSNKNQAVESDVSYQEIVNETAKNPYVDKTNNNQDFNLNTQNVKRGQKLFYVLTLDTTPYDNTSLLTTMGMEDTIDTSMLDIDMANIKAYDASGKEVVKGGFDNKLNGKTLTMNMNILKSIFVDKNGVEVSKGTADAKEIKVVDTTKLPLGQQYKIVIPATVKSNADADKDIINVARQIVINSSNKQLSMNTETRVNKLKVPSTPVKSETPPSPVNKIANIYLPKTGDAKSIMAALGAWIVTFAAVISGVVLNERKHHTLTNVYQSIIKKIRK